MSKLFLVAFAAAAALLTAATVYADDAAGLNSRVCNNISLTAHERESCTREMQTARTDEDKAKVRKEYEDKILAARAKKSGG